MRASPIAPVPRNAGRQGGFSLIELMVSIVIGFAVISALLTAYTASVQSGRNGQAVIQMTEDASTALNLMRSQVAMAGYGTPNGALLGKFTTIMSGQPYLFGCDGSGFTDSSLAIGSLGCGAAGTSDSLAVAYQVQVDASGAGNAANGVLNGGIPYDCIGNALAGPPFIADSHFYIATPASATTSALYCRQGGSVAASTAGQPVAENIVNMQVKYLQSSLGIRPAQVQFYQDAPSTSPAGVQWASVAAVRLCVEVVSATPMTDANANYYYVDCKENRVQSTDGRLHRSFTTTVALQVVS